MKKYLIVTECALEHNGKFLVIRRPEGVHAEGFLAFPGGKVEEQDEGGPDILKSAARREVFEEVGLTLVDDLHYVASSYFKGKSGHEVINMTFYCQIEKTTLTIKASAREVPEYHWMTAGEIKEAINAPSWLKAALNLIDQQKKVVGPAGLEPATTPL